MAEGVGFEPTVQLPVRLISSQVPSTNSATLPLRSNRGGEDSVNRCVVDDLVDLLLLGIPLFLTKVLVIVRELVHRSPEKADQSGSHGIEPLRGIKEECGCADDAAQRQNAQERV